MDHLSFLESLDGPADRPTHPAALGDEALMAQCVLTRGRASGPGGQHRNKVETHVTIAHTPTGIEAQAGERRLAKENQRVALKRLRLKLAVEHRIGVPAGEIRSDLWRSRCQKGKVVCSVRHRDYPSLVAEALDVIEASACDMRKAATRLGATSSQLVRLLADHPPALARLNDARRDRGMRPLRP